MMDDITKTLIWLFTPMLVLILFELFLPPNDDDDDSDGGIMQIAFNRF